MSNRTRTKDRKRRHRKSRLSRNVKGTMQGTAPIVSVQAVAAPVVTELPPRRAKFVAASNIEDMLMDDDDDNDEQCTFMEDNASIEAYDSIDINSNASSSIKDIVTSSMGDDLSSELVVASTDPPSTRHPYGTSVVIAASASVEVNSSPIIIEENTSTEVHLST